MILIDRRYLLANIVSLFLGVLAGYVIGWYFAPTTTVSQLMEKSDVASPPVAATGMEKLSDIAISESGNVLISTPRPGDTISTPLMINGLARAFENRVQVRLRNAEGVEVRKTSFSAKKGEVGTYIALAVDLVFAQPTVPQDGTLEVFTIAPKDGSEVDKVIIPIKFAQHGGSGL